MRALSHLSVFALLLVVGGGGCFLYPSPDDTWDDAYGRPPASTSDASADGLAVESGSGPCAQAASCLTCCDGRQSDLNAGDGFFTAVFHCACNAGRCAACGPDCTNRPDPSSACLTCLASESKSACATSAVAKSCGAGSKCEGYALCIAGCEP